MATLTGFLGRILEIPGDRRYAPAKGLWVRRDGVRLVVGLTEPALLLAGGVGSWEWLVESGRTVAAGETVAVAITGRLLYVDTPLAGRIATRPELARDAAPVRSDPYGAGWLFSIDTGGDPDAALAAFATPETYAEALRGSEGCRNPSGAAGRGSGVCRAIYSGLREQRF